MKRTLILVAVASVTAGVAFGVLARGGESSEAGPSGTSDFVSGREGGVVERLADGAKVKEETKRRVGTFRLGPGRALELATAETVDGKSCLLDEDPVRGSGAMCLDGGLFSVNKAAFSISSDGGPERFSELVLQGIAAPGITEVVVSKSNSTTEEVVLNRERAFVFVSSASELERDVVPTGLRVYGRGGRLVETIEIPDLR